MKHIYTFILLSFVLFSCNSDDNDPEVACLRTSPITNGNLYIALVNAEGENLIANQTYIADDITIDDLNSGTTASGVVFTGVQGLENLIGMGIYGEEGNNTFEINLSDTETDTLILNLVREEFGDICPVSLLIPTAAIYNGEVVEIQEDTDIGYLITVVKE